MSAKNLVLIAAAVAVVLMGIYLFIQVRATPAQAHVSSTTPTPTTPTRTAANDTAASTSTPEVAKAKPDTHRGGGAGKIRIGNDVIDPTVAPPPGLPPEEGKVNLKLDNLMELANKAYDRQDFDEATAIAGKVLAKEPNNTRMLRIIVSASCIQGDTTVAQTHYEKLPEFDRAQMKTRCDRYGVTFKDP